MSELKDTDKRKGTCRRCKKTVNTEDVRRKHGSCSHVYMLNYCSAQCYTKDSLMLLNNI